MAERETIAVVLNVNEPTIIPLADAIAEWFRLNAVKTERPLLQMERRVFAALEIAFGTISTTGAAERLYEAVK